MDKNIIVTGGQRSGRSKQKFDELVKAAHDLSTTKKPDEPITVSIYRNPPKEKFIPPFKIEWRKVTIPFVDEEYLQRTTPEQREADFENFYK